jgi:hypothetical protein
MYIITTQGTKGTDFVKENRKKIKTPVLPGAFCLEKSGDD